MSDTSAAISAFIASAIGLPLSIFAVISGKRKFYRNSARIVSLVWQKRESRRDDPQNKPPVNVKKMTMLASYYSKIEIRVLMAIATMLIAFLIAVSAARGATHKPAELTVIDETNSVWKTQSADGQGAFAAFKWGLEGDIRVPADYDGDGITDIAVWRPATGNWHILRTSDGATLNIKWKQTGAIGDIPVPADFDGDNIADLAVWRPENGTWYVLTSRSGFSGSSVSALGSLGDIPVPADYDGDGRADA